MILCAFRAGAPARVLRGGKSRGMNAPTETDRLHETACGAGSAGLLAPASHPEHVYDLRLSQGCSDLFFKDAARFCDELIEEMEQGASSILDAYSHHVRLKLCEAPRSRGEYALDLLTLGMALSIYAPKARRAPPWAVAAARELGQLRNHAKWMKPAVDLARGILFREFLSGTFATGSGGEANGAGADLVRQLPALVAWMRATGELEQEAQRVDHWRSYIGTLDRREAACRIEVALDLFSSFEREAGKALGSYTQSVEGFLAGEYAHRGCREDQLFCGRTPVEYHLNVVAAEMMNRGLRTAFERTARKVVLVPTCMRGTHADTCKAKVRGVDMTCAACDPECSVNYITRRMRKIGATVYMVPHTTGFSRWLDRWEREPGVGVTAVACLLNILPGGLRCASAGSQHNAYRSIFRDAKSTGTAKDCPPP